MKIRSLRFLSTLSLVSLLASSALAQITGPGAQGVGLADPAVTKKAGNEALRPAYDSLQKGDLKMARKLFQAAAEKNPDELLPKLGLADVANRSGETDECERLLKAAARQHDLDPAVHVALGRFLYSRGYFVEAEKALKRAAELKPAAYIYSDLGSLYAEGLRQTDNAIAAFKKALELEPTNAGTCYAIGQLYTRKNDFKEARMHYSLAAKLDPKNPLAWSALAQAERSLGDLEAAIRAGRTAAELDKKNFTVKLALADIYAAAKKEADAGYWFKQALTTAPKSPIVPWRYGMFLHANGHAADADAQYAKALELEPKMAAAWNNRAVLALEQPDGVTRALEFAGKAAELQPRDPNVLDTLGSVQLKAGRTADARKSLEAALAAEPNFPTAKYHLAQVAAGEGKKSDAAKLLREALASQVTFPERKAAEELLKTLGG